VDYIFQVPAEDIQSDLGGNQRIANGVVDMGAYECALPDAMELLNMLAGKVVEFVELEGIEESLLAKLETAMRKLEGESVNNDVAATNCLDAFVNAVKAHSGKKISQEHADELIVNAQEIRSILYDK
jgi:hypothetical protein